MTMSTRCFLLAVLAWSSAVGGAAGENVARETIFQEDFEQGFDQRAARWKGSAEVELTEKPGLVISGGHSLKIAGGKIAVLDPRLHVDPSMLVQLSFDFRVTQPMEPGLRPHGEARLVGVSHIVPYLHHNFVRQDNRRGLAKEAGRSSTRVWHVPYEDDLRLIFRVIGPAAVLIDNVRVEAWPTAGTEARAAPEKAPVVLPLAVDIDPSMAGLDVRWKSQGKHGAAEYQVQFSPDGTFGHPIDETKSVGAWKAGQVFSHHPQHALEPGEWAWRVRPRNSKGSGPWSGVGKFKLLADRPAKAIPYRPGPERPLIVIEGGPDKWERIPEDLKPYVWLKMRGFRSYQRTMRGIEFCEKNSVPVVLFRFGPGAGLEKLFRDYDCIRGVAYSESGAHGYNPRRVLLRSLRLARQYGKAILHQDGQWRQLVWIKMAVNPEWHEPIEKYGDWFFPQVKYNFAFAPLLSQTAIVGMWLCGEVPQWGIQAESWYYHPWKHRADCQSPYYGQMTLACVAAGGAVLAYELDIWGTRGLRSDKERPVEDGFSWTWSHLMIPLYREIIHQGLIPDREEVMDQVRCGILARERDQHNVGGQYAGGAGITWGSGDFFPILDGAYGMRHHGELIPNSGRFYFLPVIPDRVPERRRPVSRPLTVEEFPGAQKTRQFLRQAYPAPQSHGGSGFVTKAGHCTFVMHDQEQPNQSMDVRQPAKIEKENFWVKPDREYARRIEGELDIFQYLVVQEKDPKLRLHCGNTQEAKTELTVHADRRPVLSVSPKSALNQAQWAGGKLTMVISHTEGAVNVEIR
ncbi:MAG: glycoside hydrolase family 98 domain-containing protein [Candidatus Brocadiia bacterium]